MSDPTCITGFERARKEAVTLLRRIADDLEAADRRRAPECLERFDHALQELDRAAQLVLWPEPPPDAPASLELSPSTNRRGRVEWDRARNAVASGAISRWRVEGD